MPITHKFESQKPDSADTTIVNPTNWNDDHNVDLSQINNDPQAQNVPGCTSFPATKFNLVAGSAASPNAVPGSVALFQQINGLPDTNSIPFVFDGSNADVVDPGKGVIVLSSAAHDQTVARGGVAVRALAYCDKPPASSVMVSATIVGSEIIIITNTPHLAHVNNTLILSGSTGITGLTGNFDVTVVDSPTQLRVAKGGLTGGPASGGTVTVGAGYYALWTQVFKLAGPEIRTVCCESDLINDDSDAGPDGATVKATYNFVMYSSGNFYNTIGLFLDGTDSSRYYYPLKFGATAVVPGYPYIDTSANNNAYAADFARIGNNQALRWSDTDGGFWPCLFLSGGNNFFVSAPAGFIVSIGANLSNALSVSETEVAVNKRMTEIQVPNFIALETGTTNAIAGALLNAQGNPIAPTLGLKVVVYLVNSLQAGANTFDLNGTGPVAIKSNRNPANNIAVAYAIGAMVELIYDTIRWLDMNQ